MGDDLTRGIVRILKSDGSTSGTGFLVSADGLIATCAHVIEGNDGVSLVFNSSDVRRAAVEPEYLRVASAEDVAFLRLDGAVPEGAQPLKLGASAGSQSHALRTFGYPQVARTEGMWGSGSVVGSTKQESGHTVLQLAEASEITRGFSGAPVFDLVTRRVIGMVNSITAADEYGRQTETVFVTPSEVLQQIGPQLDLIAIPVSSRLLKGLEGDPLPYLIERAAQRSAIWIQENTAAQRYISQVYSAREAMQSAINEFMSSNLAGFVLTGESGAGKTSLLCHLLEIWRDSGEIVLAFPAQSLTVENSMEERILLDLRLTCSFMDLIEFLNISDRELIVLVDGVNEHEDAPQLLKQLSTFIQRYASAAPKSNRPSLKVLLSFRSSFLDKVLETLLITERDEPRIFPEFAFMYHQTLEGESTKEGGSTKITYRFELGRMGLKEIEAAYEAYRTYGDSSGAAGRYRPTTPFSQIDPEWHPVLANPFYLRLAVEAYNGRPIPARPWHGEIMRSFCELKIYGRGSDQSRYAERAELIDELVSLMRRRQTAAFRKEEFQDISPRWDRALQDSDRSRSPYLQLLDEGVLMETSVRELSGRSMRSRYFIRFALDTLFEYLLGDDILREVGGWENLQGSKFADELKKSDQFPYLAGAIEHLLLDAVDECNFAPFIGLINSVDPGVRDQVYEELSPHVTIHKLPSGDNLVFYDRTGTDELFDRLEGGRFIHKILWKLYEWGDEVTAPLSDTAGPTRGQGRPSRWHRNFKRLFEAIGVGADAKAAFNILVWMAGRAGQLKDNQLTPHCHTTATKIRTHRIDAGPEDRLACDESAGVLLVQAHALADVDRFEEAIKMGKRAIDRLEKLPKKTPELNGQLAECLVQIAALYGKSGHSPETIESAKKAAELFRSLPVQKASHKEMLLNALKFQRMALRSQGMEADFEGLAAERIEVMRDLIGSHGVSDYVPYLAEELREMSSLANDKGHRKAALTYATDSVELLRTGHEEAEPKTKAKMESENLLAKALVFQSAAFRGIDDVGASYQALSEAIAIWGLRIKEGDQFSVAHAIKALAHRYDLCASVNRWDLAGADVVTAFHLYLNACQKPDPPATVIDVFTRLMVRLIRLQPAHQEELYRAMDPDNASIVKDFLSQFADR